MKAKSNCFYLLMKAKTHWFVGMITKNDCFVRIKAKTYSFGRMKTTTYALFCMCEHWNS
jgi:hypothetical protein